MCYDPLRFILSFSDLFTPKYLFTKINTGGVFAIAFSSKGASFVRVLACYPLAAVVFGGLGLLLDALGCLGLPLASFGATVSYQSATSQLPVSYQSATSQLVHPEFF